MTFLNGTTIRTFVLAGAAAVSAFGQIWQDHPELCGKPNQWVPVPSQLTAASSGSETVLYVALSSSQARIPISADSILQVCPLPGSRLVVFGSLSDIVSDLEILDTSDGRVLDSFWSYSALMSPDQRWLVFRRFYPFILDILPSEQYLLYDLVKNADGNRFTTPHQAGVPGKVIYPVVPDHIPYNNIGLPREQLHDFRSDAFHWTPDSSSVFFADDLQGQVSVVWVKIGATGETTAYLHNVSVADVCASDTSPKEAILNLEDVRVNTTDGEPLQIFVRFAKLQGECLQHELILRPDDFSLARTEIHAPEQKKRPSVGIKAK